jgi:hypothetical protein
MKLSNEKAARKMLVNCKSISPTFYEQHFCSKAFVKNLISGLILYCARKFAEEEFLKCW